MNGWRFAVPPSLGRDPVRALARDLADLLYDAGFTTVHPQPSYARIEEALMSGEVDAAWGPPMICARVESAGGQVALRAIRWGAATYRAVIVCRVDDRLELRELGVSRRRPRAIWVDEWSMAGFVLPRAHLRSLGLELGAALFSERLAGSYEAALHEVLDGTADITSAFCSAASGTRRAAGYVELCGFRAVELRELAYTAESPNDGVVLSPRLPPEKVQALRRSLRALAGHPATRKQLAQAFSVDGFDEPPAGSFTPLLQLVR